MIDRDLAALYGVETKRLKEAVRRNRNRFPDDFMFELNINEMVALEDAICVLQRTEKRSAISSILFYRTRSYDAYHAF